MPETIPPVITIFIGGMVTIPGVVYGIVLTTFNEP
jgi:ABC-type branched-subunit amino acid transport system permease subunit